MGASEVVVTGIGVLTPIGHGARALWEAVLTGRTGTRALSFPWLEHRPFRCRVGAPVSPPGLEEARLTRREGRHLDPASRLLLAAAAQALDDAGLRTEPAGDDATRFRVLDLDPEGAGVVVGTGIGGLATLEVSHERWSRGEPITGRLRFALPMLIPNAPAAQVAIKYGLNGECKTVATACASGAMAIGDAFHMLQRGELDVVLAGGVDQTLSDHDGYSLYGFELLGTLSRRNDDPEHASRPFDRDRDGFVLGEGAALLVLEREAHARARGARAYARIVGYAATCDAHSMVQLEPNGAQMARTMRAALRAAGLAPQDVCYVNAHGTATRQNDVQEARAIRAVFGPHVAGLVVNATKAMTGHAVGAAGAIEAAVTALSLAQGLAHRCVNLDHPDPECELPFPWQNTELDGRAALSNSFGFGGHNACLALVPA